MKALILVLVYLGVAFAGFIGWILNLVAIAHAVGGPLTALLVVRIVGIFAAPLGAVMGYIS